MKKFIWKLFSFISIPIIFILPIEVCIAILNKNIFSEESMEKVFNTEGFDYRWICRINKTKKILLLGSSSVKYGLSCTRLNNLAGDTLSFINLAMNARDPISTYFILKQIDLANVKAVYFGLDPWIFAKSYYKNRNSYLYLDMNFYQALIYSREHDKSFFLKRYKAFYKYLFPINKLDQRENYKTPMDFGSEKLLGKPINFNQPINEIYQIEKYGWSKLQFIYLSKIVQFCKSKKIIFSAFIPPKRSDYSSTYKLKCNLIHNQYINILIRENFTAPIFGKVDQLDSLGNIKLFQDAYHLNSLGQEIYSKVFYEMIIEDKDNFNLKYKWFNNVESNYRHNSIAHKY